jgi:hypothetical protein
MVDPAPRRIQIDLLAILYRPVNAGRQPQRLDSHRVLCPSGFIYSTTIPVLSNQFDPKIAADSPGRPRQRQ